ncbi:hypothetical protein [Emticicia sp. 17c]|uniref:hypothetical protein n=1 Tax=Emticicia sp. 17c TaxID=3127704 RepID=UPI00301C3A4E
MAKKKEDKLKKLIQGIEPDQPALDFTETLMQKIQRQEETAMNEALQSLLIQYAVETPSTGFTEKLLAAIEKADKKPVYKPIIGAKVWYKLGIAASVIFGLLVFFSKPASVSGKSSEVANIINRGTHELMTSISTLPSLFLMGFFAISLLILLDFWVVKKI